VTSRLPALLIAFLAIPGLLVRQGTLVVHEHDGGSDPHHHSPLVGYVDHAHPHDHDARESDPARDDESSDEDGAPDDGDRHGHYQAVHAAAVRRTALGDDAGARQVGVAFSRVALPYEEPGRETFGPAPSPGDRRGHPPSRTGRTIDRLVQGIGLLI
jgi:hypothetical protein